MIRAFRLVADSSGNAAVEMALVVPLLLALMLGSVELSNYFLNEHILIKAVRDGARFASRQDMANFTACSGTPGGSVATNTTNIVKSGLLAGGGSRMDFTGATITISVTCAKTVGGSTMGGLYNAVTDSSGSSIGAPVVTVSATVPYRPVLNSFGFTGSGLNLKASEQAAVTGW